MACGIYSSNALAPRICLSKVITNAKVAWSLIANVAAHWTNYLARRYLLRVDEI